MKLFTKYPNVSIHKKDKKQNIFATYNNNLFYLKSSHNYQFRVFPSFHFSRLKPQTKIKMIIELHTKSGSGSIRLLASTLLIKSELLCWTLRDPGVIFTFIS